MAELAYGEVYAMNKAKARLHLIDTLQRQAASVKLPAVGVPPARPGARLRRALGVSSVERSVETLGGDNPQRIAKLTQRFLHSLAGDLRRYPLGRNRYSGRVERSHRTDDEEFYRPYLLKVQDEEHFLQLATRWIYFYKVLRPHFGKGIDKQPPLQVLKRLGYSGDDRIALFPPILLDRISADLLLACHPQDGNDLLAHYSLHCTADGVAGRDVAA